MSEQPTDYFAEMLRLKAAGWFYKFYDFPNLSPDAYRHIVFTAGGGAMGLGHSEQEAWQKAIDSELELRAG